MQTIVLGDAHRKIREPHGVSGAFNLYLNTLDQGVVGLACRGQVMPGCAVKLGHVPDTSHLLEPVAGRCVLAARAVPGLGTGPGCKHCWLPRSSTATHPVQDKANITRISTAAGQHVTCMHVLHTSQHQHHWRRQMHLQCMI